MAIALGSARPGGELTPAQALGRLRRRAPIPVNVAAVAVALVVAGVVIALAYADEVRPYEAIATVGLGLAIATCAALGALIVAGRPSHGLGLALLSGGVLGAVWVLAMALERADGAVGHWAAWLENWAFVGLVVLVTWPLLLFPDGRLPSRRWRPVAWLLATATAGVAVSGMLDPGTLESVAGEVSNPLGIPASWTWIEALGALGVGVPLGVVAGMVAVHRRACSDSALRPALWASRALAANFVLCLALNVTGSPLADGAFYAATLTVSVSVFAAAATLAVLRHRAIDIDVLLRRAFIVAGVGVGSLLVFVIAFAAGAALIGSSSGALGGAVAVAAIAFPLRIRVREAADRALYGHRDPGRAARRLSEQLDLAPADALPGVAEALREALGASAVVIVPEPHVAPKAVRAGGDSYEPALHRAITRQGTTLARLTIGARAPGEAYGAGDIALAETLIRQLALVLDVLRMASEVQESREAIVNAREEERRRLRRDLHDGLGSALAGIALTLQAARNAGGAHGDELVDAARAQMETAVADVRRIVRDLRPPVLEDLGLAAALRAHAERVRPLRVALVLDDPLPPLPAAVELAIYRITTEALTNTVRHAQASSCRVGLHVADGEASLAIADDGIGLAADVVAGVGLRSMRERAAELGGRVEFATGPSGGLAVDARFPLAAVGAA